jgi:hypothetical protein
LDDHLQVQPDPGGTRAREDERERQSDQTPGSAQRWPTDVHGRHKKTTQEAASAF